MDKKLFKHLILLITYAVVLVVVIVKIDTVAGWLSAILSAFQPLFIGFAVAFVLNRPCNFFARLYEGHLPGRTRQAARPLAVVTAYVILLAILAVLISLVVPELINSLQTFVNNMGTYAAKSSGVVRLGGADPGPGSSGRPKSVRHHQRHAEQGPLWRTGRPDYHRSPPHFHDRSGSLRCGYRRAGPGVLYLHAHGGPRPTAQCRRLAITYLPGRVVESAVCHPYSDGGYLHPLCLRPAH